MQRHMIEWDGNASEGMARVIAPQLQEPLTVETTVADIFKMGCEEKDVDFDMIAI